MPYGSHVVPDRRQMVHLGAMCALYKADGPLRRVGAIWEPALAVWELYVLYRSHAWVWEVDGTTWGQHSPHGGHMGAMCTVQEPYGTI
jgi:hypothetical protein